MSKITLMSRKLILIVFVAFGTLAYSQVGIGTTTPTEMLDVAGNVKFSGAIMPNNLPGTADQVLLSKGVGAAPQWSPFMFLNLAANNGIGKFYSNLNFNGNWMNNTFITFIINDPNLLCGGTPSAAFMSFECTYSNAIIAGLTVRNVKVNAGNLAITVVNNTGSNLVGGGTIPVSLVLFY